MNKLFTKIASLALGAAMAVGVGVAVSGKNVSAAHADTSPATFTVSSYASAHSWTGSGGGPYGQGSTNALDIDANVSVYCTGSSNSGKYYTDWRMYQSESATVVVSAKSDSVKLTAITFTYGQSNGGCLHTSKAQSVTAYYSTGTKKTLSSVSSVTAYVANTGTKTNGQARITSIVVEYTVTASKTVSSVSSSGHKTSFANGESFAYGGTLTATYSDSTSSSVTPTSFKYGASGINPTSAGTAITVGTALSYATHNDKYIYVLYTESGTTVYTSYQISVSAPKTPASVSSSGHTTTFTAGDTFAYGGTLTATYTDSTNATVTPSSFKIGDAGINPISAGTVIVPGTTVLNRNDHHGKTVYVLYEENSTTVYASYTISVATISKISFVGGTDIGTAGGQGQSDTLTKSGISMSCDSCYTKSGAYRFYSGSTLTISSTVGNIAKIEFNMNGSYNSNLLSTSTGTYNSDDSSKGVWTGDAASIDFDLSAQARCDSVDITLASNDPLVELAPGSSSEVSMFKGDQDTSVKVLVKNIETKTWSFTFDEDAQEGITTSSYISVSAGAAVSDVHTLTITTKAIGSTTMHIAVSGTACETAIPVTVNAKPASMTINHSDIHEGELEIITGLYKQVSFSGLDTDGNPYSIAAADVTPSATSGASYVTLSGTRITGASQGTAVVRYTLKALTSVYAEVTVNVVDDYIETVGEPTFATGLTDTQGQSPDVSVFTSRPGTMHSGTSTTILFENYKFSYESTYASAEYGDVFSYDFSHGTTVDSTHKLQTIYVFCDIDEAAHGSYTVTVEQFNDPLTAITFTNVTENAVNVARGSTFQLEWAYTPENPTDGKEVVFRIDTNDDNISITVSESGLISIGASSNLGEALVIMESAHDETIYDFVMVSAVLETMKYTVREDESWSLVSDPTTLVAGDVVVMTGEKNSEILAMGTYSSGNNVKAVVSSPLTVSDGEITAGITDAMIYTLVSGTTSGTIAFEDSTGNYLNACSSGSNYMHSESSVTVNSSFAIDDSGNVYASGSSYTRNYMRFNPNGSNDAIFSCYASTSTTGSVVTFYKRSGGDTPFDVTADLFNAVHNNFGEGKTYEWSESCPAFDEDAWVDACAAITDLSDYSSYKLNRAVANISGNEIEVLLAKYDNIITKFGTAHDWLGRFDEGGINHGSLTKVNSLSLLTNNGTEVAIIVVASMIGLSAVGGYFLLRKRKENI